MALRGEPDALIDACIHLANTDDVQMQLLTLQYWRTKHVKLTHSVQVTLINIVA